jgi:RimJ/RimL family protein N-acetyltransferase
VIIGERVRLRAISRDDLPIFVAWLNDPEVRAGLSLFVPLSVDNEQKWYDAMLQEPAEEHPLTIEIRTGEEWVMAGNCGFHKIEWRNRSAEVGIFIGDKSYWNQGYGTETMRLLLCHGFETLNLNRIFLRVFSTNARAIRAYEKVGFIREGLFRQAEYQNGRYIDVLFMSVLRSEWKDAQPQAE